MTQKGWEIEDRVGEKMVPNVNVGPKMKDHPPPTQLSQMAIWVARVFNVASRLREAGNDLASRETSSLMTNVGHNVAIGFV